MASLKDEHLALSSGIGSAGLAIDYFYQGGDRYFEYIKEDIFHSIVKPNKTTSVHLYLSFFQNISDEIGSIKGNVDDLEYLFNYIYRTLEGVNLKPNLPIPNFDSCSDSWHDNCSCKVIVEKWEKFVDLHSSKIDDMIIHSAFQVIFLDRKFLHDFHLELSDFIEVYVADLKAAHPNYVTEKNRIKRHKFPKWLTDAVFYRDKGTCSNPQCRCDLTKLIRTQNTIHIDHIVPLQLFGSNDATNFQLLCETCNTSKGARLTATSSVNIPFWNLN